MNEETKEEMKETTKEETNKTKTISKNMYNLLVSVSIISVIALIGLFTLYTNSNQKEVVASVDETELTETQLYDEMKKTVGTNTLNTLIDNTVVEKELEKENITIEKEAIDREKENILKTFPDKEAFKKALKENGLTEESFEKDIVKYLKIDKVLKSRVKISEEEIKKSYEEEKSYSVIVEQINANHILVETKEVADEVLAKLKSGQKFSDLAKEYSKDETNANEGGSLGSFGKGTMEKAFEDAAFAMTKEGEISAPIKTSFGFHIIELVSKTPGKTLTFEEAKTTIENDLMTKQVEEEYGKWITEIKKDYKIKTEFK
jgi:foldase protein PrsA